MFRLLTIVVSSLFIFIPGFAQDNAPETQAAAEIKYDETMAEEEAGGSVSGIVVSVNPVLGSLVVRDTEEDASIYNINVKKATTYAGLTSLADIDPGDTISVDCYGPLDHLVAETITLQDKVRAPAEPAKLQKVLSD